MIEEIKVNEFVKIDSLMATKLKLSGNELIVFALVHGFRKSESGTYYGGNNHVAKCYNIHPRNVKKIFDRLLVGGYISKKVIKKNGISYNEYRSNYDDDYNLITHGETPSMANQHGDYGETPDATHGEMPSNKIDKNKIQEDRERDSHSNSDSFEEEKSHEQSECGRREKENVAIATSAQKKKRRVPSLEEAKAYFRESGFRSGADKFYLYYQAKGWKGIEDWKAQADLWELREIERHPERKETRKDNRGEEYIRMIEQEEKDKLRANRYPNA